MPTKKPGPHNTHRLVLLILEPLSFELGDGSKGKGKNKGRKGKKRKQESL
jgi:hypothetical protein